MINWSLRFFFHLTERHIAMKKTRYTEEQIAFALKQAETGICVGEVCRKMGISEAIFIIRREIRCSGRNWTWIASSAATGGWKSAAEKACGYKTYRVGVSSPSVVPSQWTWCGLKLIELGGVKGLKICWFLRAWNAKTDLRGGPLLWIWCPDSD